MNTCELHAQVFLPRQDTILFQCALTFDEPSSVFTLIPLITVFIYLSPSSYLHLDTLQRET